MKGVYICCLHKESVLRHDNRIIHFYAKLRNISSSNVLNWWLCVRHFIDGLPYLVRVPIFLKIIEILFDENSLFFDKFFRSMLHHVIILDITSEDDHCTFILQKLSKKAEIERLVSSFAGWKTATSDVPHSCYYCEILIRCLAVHNQETYKE
jgi:hypothetical protein